MGREDNKLPANVRVNHERELAALKSRLVDTEKEIRRRNMIERYHMVRFFERKRAEKNLRRAERELKGFRESGAEGVEEVEKQVERARVDLNYAMYTPLVWRYCALWPKEKKGKEEDDAVEEEKGGGGSGDEKQAVSDKKPAESAVQGDPAMWERVRKATEEGQKALERLRDATDWRDPADGGVIRQRQEMKLRSKKGTSTLKGEHPKRERAKLDRTQGLSKHEGEANSDAESDGGFFE